MNIQIIIWLLIGVFYLNITHKEYNKREISRLVRFGCFLLIIESGLRHISVGPDTVGYYNSFYSAMEMDWSSVLANLFVSKTEFRDPGYAIVTKLFATIIPSWQLFLLACAVLYYYSLGRLMSKYCTSCTSVFLGFTLILALFDIIALSGQRQMITMAISMLSIESIMDRRWIRSIIFISIGSLIHISCLFTLFFIPFVYIKDRPRQTIHLISLFIYPLTCLFAREIVHFMASFSANEYYLGYARQQITGDVYTFVVIAFLISLFVFIKNDNLDSGGNEKAAKAGFLKPAAILMALTAPLIIQDSSLIRICQYFSIYLVITVGNIVDNSRDRKLEYFVMFCFLLFFVITEQSDYHFFWQSVRGYIYNYPFFGR